jgi:hypothetical protein
MYTYLPVGSESTSGYAGGDDEADVYSSARIRRERHLLKSSGVTTQPRTLPLANVLGVGDTLASGRNENVLIVGGLRPRLPGCGGVGKPQTQSGQFNYN